MGDPTLLASLRARTMGEIRAFWVLSVVFLAVATTGSAVAQTAAPPGVEDPATPALTPEDTLETPYTLAMGSGVRAAATGTSALAYNNSNMGATRSYDIEAFSQIIPGDGMRTGRSGARSPTPKPASGSR